MTTDSKVYEVAFLAKSLDEEKALAELIKQYQGNVVQRGAFQEVKLAYPIKKQTSAYFGYLRFEFLPENVDKLSETLKLHPGILRHLIVTPSTAKKMVERRPEAPEAVKPAPVSRAAVLTNEALEERLEEILK
ncbi:MAG: 30S ribosomal protein S6 [bacterium]|nr:30S ribosomal protein S6 [bacterium]